MIGLSLQFLIIISLLLGATLMEARSPRRLQPEDIFALKDVAAAQISPDGSRVAFTASEASADRSGAQRSCHSSRNLSVDRKRRVEAIERSQSRLAPTGPAFPTTRVPI
jgi:hypothetical protein